MYFLYFQSLQNYVISFYFHLYLMLHSYAAKFDVTRNLEMFLVFKVN